MDADCSRPHPFARRARNASAAAALLAISLTAASCAQAPPANAKSVGEIPAPAGYARPAPAEGSFGAYLAALPLKPDKSIKDWRGGSIGHFDVLAVIDKPMLYQQDLEQCADWCMRHWADFHAAKGDAALKRLSLFKYDGSPDRFASSGKDFKEFLRLAMAFSNSHSIKKGAQKVDPADLRPGDMIVQNETGGIGHVSMVLAKAEKPGAEPVFLIGFSFMPAQEFHIERAGASQGEAGWFTLAGFQAWLKQNLDVGEPVLRRFPEG
ncbi:MAG: DUF4846 domain-containing protein [Verrucomicrobiales bacterium]